MVYAVESLRGGGVEELWRKYWVQSRACIIGSHSGSFLFKGRLAAGGGNSPLEVFCLCLRRKPPNCFFFAAAAAM